MFRNKDTNCVHCNKKISVHEKSWILMPYPTNGIANMQKVIELDGKVYCTSCITIKQT
ncbi:hypothetical protein BLX06_33740 [Bacillus cereus]|uniref:Fe3+ hydroxamate ABC transporter substrate-binding protein n=1 Tax=Bacillus cereus TaxID=1396 RepID=A0A9X6GC00_BACCE|nr:hypothetical protein BLX06_33740 [Bacillus cereus]PHG57715.1 hypothetical protein COI59_29325 [Bacillus toyonensis]